VWLLQNDPKIQLSTLVEEFGILTEDALDLIQISPIVARQVGVQAELADKSVLECVWRDQIVGASDMKLLVAIVIVG